jgi:hypothetical protein
VPLLLALGLPEATSVSPCHIRQRPGVIKGSGHLEQIGQLARVTAYLHVHIELSITSVEQQLSKYQQLLVTKLGTEESICNFRLG